MNIWLAYGKTGINFELNDNGNMQIVEPKFTAGIDDPVAAIRNVLKSPISEAALDEFAKPADKVGIIFSDITRHTPNEIILPVILAELDHIPSENIILFVALGTHRANTESELRTMIGDDIYENYRIIQNDSFDRSTQTLYGQINGRDIWLNRELMNCDVKILTGFIEPHFFAGFSGGGKAIMPGMAGQETILGNHDTEKIGSRKAVWGVTEGNPIFEEIHQVTDKIANTFLVNVALNRDKEITAVFAGNLRAAHKKGCDFVRQNAMVAVDEPFDIVLTSNSGYPLDLNLYQSIKGLSAAVQVVKKGGSIIIASECWDGIPDHGLYGKLLSEASSPQDLLNTIAQFPKTVQDQWQVQAQAQIQLKADVYVYSDNLSDEQIKNALLIPCRNIEKKMSELLLKYGENARICVLPEGPQTVPYVL